MKRHSDELYFPMTCCGAKVGAVEPMVLLADDILRKSNTIMQCLFASVCRRSCLFVCLVACTEVTRVPMAMAQCFHNTLFACFVTKVLRWESPQSIRNV